MGTYEPRAPRTNREVARNMLIVGVAFVVAAVALDFFVSSLVDMLNSISWPARDYVSRLWSLVTRLGYSLGPVLIVGAIIVNRLPERRRLEANEPPA